MKYDPIATGRRVAERRHAAGLTQHALADGANVSQPWLARLEKGRAPSPSVFALMRLAEALDCAVDDLVGHGVEPH